LLPEHSFEGLLNLHRYLGSLFGRKIESSLPITLVGARGLRLYPCVTCGVGERSSHLSGLELVRLQVLEIWFCHNVDLFERLSGACHLALKSFGRDEELRLTAVDRVDTMVRHNDPEPFVFILRMVSHPRPSDRSRDSLEQDLVS
jgi:hypothetical protein